MKGIVFVEFVDMVEKTFSEETAFKMITNSNLPSGGAYTAVGTYEFSEMQQMIGQLSELTQMSVKDLIQAFGKHLFDVFKVKYPAFFEDVKNSFDLLLQVHDVIHVEVKKLYPDAELPDFEYEQPDSNTLNMVYTSTRRLSALAEGLIQASIDHFDEPVEMKIEALPDTEAGAEQVRFTLVRS